MSNIYPISNVLFNVSFNFIICYKMIKLKLSKVPPPISNGGGISAPLGHSAGSALEAGFANTISACCLLMGGSLLFILLFSPFLPDSVYIPVSFLNSHSLQMLRNILLPRNAYPLCFCIPDVCQTASTYSSLSDTTLLLICCTSVVFPHTYVHDLCTLFRL